MEKRILPRALLVVVIAVVLVGAAYVSAGSGEAQPGNGLWCRDARFDYDQDGYFTKADLNTWFDITRSNGCLYAEVGSADLCEQYDLDESKVVDDDDLAVAHAEFMDCAFTATDVRQ